uniref:Uncharacterized protein n=1 Tax=Arundo donax TaxID=35708 RepID=A0A0A9GMP9_ARUDO
MQAAGIIIEQGSVQKCVFQQEKKSYNDAAELIYSHIGSMGAHQN